MSARLEFILGRAGSGKTRELTRRVAEARKRGSECFVIVTEQATFSEEAELARALSGGLFGCTVSSWKALARKLLDGMGVKESFLSSEGRLMLVRRAADFVEKDLTVFKSSASRRGFPAECGELISKLKRCGLSAEDVKRAAESVDEREPLRAKLNDLALIFSELERRCLDRYIDSDDLINCLIRRMGESPLAGADVFIDGGDAMHEYAYPVFSALLTHAGSVTVAVTSDVTSAVAVFREEERILNKLMDTAREMGVPFSVTRLKGTVREVSPALKHMEAELFKPRPAVFEGAPDGLSVYAAPDRVDEVTEAAERIRRLSATVRYRDMAVIVSDIPGYAPIIKRIFPQYGIPYFTDVSRSLITHPAARLILSSLSAAESGFEAGYVLEAVKTGYFPLDSGEVEELENYLLKTGLTGKRLFEPLPEEDARYGELLLSVSAPLIHLKEGLKEHSTEARTRAIHSLLAELDVYGQQKALCARLHETGLFLEEEENAQVMSAIVEVLDQLYVIMGDEPVGMKRFISVVREGLEAHSVERIPSTLDRVLVGGLERTRTGEVKRLLVLGMNEGLFPKQRKDDGVIDDRDLALLGEKGFELWRNSKMLADSDIFAVYQAFSRATEGIDLLYPVSITWSSSLDAPAKPCRLLLRFRRVFPLLPVTDGTTCETERSGAEAAFMSMARRIRRMLDTGERDGEADALLAWFGEKPEYRPILDSIRASAFGLSGRDALSAELSEKLYGRSLYGSASRLECFNGCPFKHFMQYGIRAEEREERREKSSDLGSFYHEALEAYVRYVMDNRLDWRSIDDEKTFEILRELLPSIMYKKGSRLLYDTARQRARLVNILDYVRFTCCAVTRQIARGSFRPVGCEVSFGRSESVFPPLKIEAGDAVFWLGGIIDRIDSTGDGMTRIIDYKSGGKDFDLAALIAGLQLQLPLYAAAAGAAETVGMFYMPIRDVDPTGEDSGEAKKELTEELLREFRLSGIMLKEAEVLRATEEFDGSSTVVRVKYDKDGEPTGSGLVTRDELEFITSFAKQKSAHTLESIFGGDISVYPARLVKNGKMPCRYCPYSAVCLFDEELAKDGARDIRPVSAEEFFGRERR